MSSYAIVTDSTCDLPQTIVTQYNIIVIPLEFTIDGHSYLNTTDETALPAKEFYKLLREGSVSLTSQIPVQRYLEIFEKILLEGKDVLYLCFSSALSGSFNSSWVAAGELSFEYPKRKIYIVDTKAASLGEGLLVYHAAIRKEHGYTIEKLKMWVEENRDHFCHWFIVDDLHHLKRGGRISPTTAAVGTLLNVKPVLRVDSEGHLIPMEKVRGRRKALGKLVDVMEKNCTEPEEQTVFIGHGDCLEDAKYLEQLVRSRIPVKDVLIEYIGPIIGSHTGPDMVSLFYRGTGK